MRYFLVGFMGSGKTYWGRKWSETHGLKHFDLDEEIEKQQGKTIPEIFEKQGEVAFRKIERDTLKQFLELDDFILSCGGGTPCFFNNMKTMNKAGVTIYLKTSPADLALRLKDEKETRPLIAGMDNHVLEEFISEKLQQREPYYSLSMYHLPGKFATEENFQRIIRRHGA